MRETEESYFNENFSHKNKGVVEFGLTRGLQCEGIILQCRIQRKGHKVSVRFCNLGEDPGNYFILVYEAYQLKLFLLPASKPAGQEVIHLSSHSCSCSCSSSGQFPIRDHKGHKNIKAIIVEVPDLDSDRCDQV